MCQTLLHFHKRHKTEIIFVVGQKDLVAKIKEEENDLLEVFFCHVSVFVSAYRNRNWQHSHPHGLVRRKLSQRQEAVYDFSRFVFIYSLLKLRADTCKIQCSGLLFLSLKCKPNRTQRNF